MTIGKRPSPQLLDSAYNEIKDEKSCFCTIVDKISVEMIGEKEESIIVLEKRLR